MGVFKVKSLAARVESTFSTSSITSYSDTTRIPAEEMQFAPDQEFIARDAQLDTLGHRQAGVAGGKGGTVTFKTEVPGATTAGASGIAAAVASWLRLLLEAAGLTPAASTGTVLDVGAHSTTSLVCVDASTFALGQCVGVLNASSRLEVRLITAKSGNTLTVTPALSFTPSNGAVVYAAHNFTLGDQSQKSLSFVAKGDGYEYTLTGCKSATPKLTMSARGRPMLEWAFQVDSWTVTTTSGTLPSLPAVGGLLALGAPVYFGTGSTPTPTGEVAIDPGTTLQAQPSTEGDAGRSNWKVTDSAPTVTMKPYYSSALRTAYDAETCSPLLAQLGTTYAGAFAFAAERAQIAKFPGEADVNGLVAHDLMLQVVAPTSTATNAYVIAFL